LVRHGKERHDYQNTEVSWVAHLKKADIDAKVMLLETEIDQLQDKVDVLNNTIKIPLPQFVLDLSSAAD